MQVDVADNATVESLEAWISKVQVEEMWKAAQGEAKAKIWCLKGEALLRELRELGVLVEEGKAAADAVPENNPTRTYATEAESPGNALPSSSTGRVDWGEGL